MSKESGLLEILALLDTLSFSEGFAVRVMGQQSYADAHQSATTSESNIIKVVINPNREINNIQDRVWRLDLLQLKHQMEGGRL